MTYPLVTRWIADATGFDPTLVAGRAVLDLVAQRMRVVHADDEHAYLELLRDDPGELERLAAIVAVPETSFFRYADSYELLRRRLDERRAAVADGRPLRMASIGCATGEEPCSMAITAAAAGWPLDRVVIDAFDRCPVAIAAAEAGAYPMAAARSVPEWADAWLAQEGDRVHMRPEILAAIRYRRADALRLAVPEPPGYDVVFCRNVIIYLARDARERLIGWLVRALVPGGLLFAGHAEHGPLAACDALASTDSPRSFAFRRRPPGEGGPAAAALPSRVPAPRVARAPAAPVVRTRAAARAAPPSRPAAPSPVRRDEVTPPTLAAARGLADRGDLRAAQALAAAAMEREGPSADALELIGTIHLALEDVPRAYECFFRAVYLEPEHEPSLLQLALLCSRLGDPVQEDRYRRRAERAHRETT